MTKGLIHVYYGEGKGKTTCAFGLALRALGHGFKVLAVQFCKDGSSGELKALQSSGLSFTLLDGFEPSGSFKAEYKGSCAAKTAYENEISSAFSHMLDICKDYDMLIMDELTWGIYYNAVDCETVVDFLKNKPAHLEVVITGRYPPHEILAIADYATEMKLIKHPFDKGVEARHGIEL